MSRSAPRVRRSWVERAFDDEGPGLDRFGLLLFLTTVSVVGLALVEINGGNSVYSQSRDIGSLISAMVVGLTLIVALRASGLRRRRQRFIDLLVILVVLGYALSLLGGRTPQGTAAVGVSGVLVLLSIFAPIVVVLRLVRHREITLDTILGAISAYLLIAVAYFYLFITVNKAEGFAFFGKVEPSTTFMYFSLTTITTVGYGDFTATTPIGRLLANSEAVIGQVYLVTFVAFVVSLGASAWKSRRDEQVALEQAGAEEAD
ncbi:MAG: ion channel [Candidatus Nanopelagicales bacterium]